MNATAKFYTAFAIAIVLVIVVSGYVGYRIGYAHGRTAHATHTRVTNR